MDDTSPLWPRSVEQHSSRRNIMGRLFGTYSQMLSCIFDQGQASITQNIIWAAASFHKWDITEFLQGCGKDIEPRTWEWQIVLGNDFSPSCNFLAQTGASPPKSSNSSSRNKIKIGGLYLMSKKNRVEPECLTIWKWVKKVFAFCFLELKEKS